MVGAAGFELATPCSQSKCSTRLSYVRAVKGLSTLQRWSEQPCVRPMSAAHRAAGHNALRGSGPDQKLAFIDALTQVGCPDHRIDRFCITCCLPFPAITPRLLTRSRSSSLRLTG